MIDETALALFLPSYMVDSGYSFKLAASALAVLEQTGPAGRCWLEPGRIKPAAKKYCSRSC